MLYADFEAFLVRAEENIESASNTKVRHLHNTCSFACLRVSQVPKFHGEILIYVGEDEDDRLDRAPSRSGSLRPKHPIGCEADEDSNGGAAVVTRCGYNLRTESVTKKNKKTKHHCHLSRFYIGP